MTGTSSEELPRLGRYQVINKIAAGGMAEVFLAKAVGAMGFQRLVAIKLIHANFTRDQEFVKMFIDEARIAMHLHHRNIVQVFDLDQTNETYFIAMEFVHGVNLYDLYERIAAKGRWIEPSMGLYLVAEISKGLHFAHTRKGPDGRPLGIVHRDISPQNILLSFEGEVKITDFGIATAAERLHQTAAGIVKGKYAYMAPERLQEKPTDGRVDVFSAGVLLYELLVGENPFAGSSAVDTIENVLNKTVVPPSERGAPVSAQLDRITLKALARDPNDRYATAQDLADAITEYALELTQARKDMASGDGALAGLLADLFPERARRPPSAADPKSLNLPGIPPAGVKVQTVDASADPVVAREAAKKKNGRAPAEILNTQEDEPAKNVRDPADAGDPDEPTVLRMTPMSELSSLVPSPRSHDRSAAEDDAFTAREVTGLTDEMPGFTTSPPYPQGTDESGSHVIDTDRQWPSLRDTPITPLSSADAAADKTAPTEMPPSSSPRKPTVSRPFGTDPTGPSDSGGEHDDANASTLRTPNEMIGLADEGFRPKPVLQSSLPRAPGAGAVRESVRPPWQPHGNLQAQQIGASHESNPLVIPVQSHSSSMPIAAVAPTAPRTTTIIAILLMIIAVLVVVAAVLVIRDRDRDRVVVKNAASVTLKVTTAPPGATVTIDGLEQPAVTPYSGTVAANEDHQVSARLPGYAEPPPRTIHPPEGAAALVHFDLQSLRGSLSIQPKPADATVFINDQEKGTGNVVVNELPLGTEIVVRIEARGHRTFEQKITLEAGARDITMPIQLNKGKNPPAPKPEGRTRRVQLTAAFGTWATVYYKNRWLGTTPVFATLPVGEVQLRVVNETQKLDKTIAVNVADTGSDQITLNLR